MRVFVFPQNSPIRSGQGKGGPQERSSGGSVTSLFSAPHPRLRGTKRALGDRLAFPVDNRAIAGRVPLQPSRKPPTITGNERQQLASRVWVTPLQRPDFHGVRIEPCIPEQAPQARPGAERFLSKLLSGYRVELPVSETHRTNPRT